MTEKTKVFSVTVPGAPPENAKEFIRSLVTPTQDPKGNLSPPPRITFDRESGLRSEYIVGDLTFRSLGIDTDGFPLATVIKAVVLQVKDDVFVCPECRAEHSRGPLDPLSKVYRCLRCGYVGRRVKDEWVPCPECEGSGMVGAFDNPLLENLCSSCAGKGRVRKDAPGPMVLTGDVEKGPVDKPKTVETPEEFAGEFGDGKTFPSDEGKQKLKRRILDRMTAVDMVDAISNGCDLPNLADIIIDLYPPEEIYEMTPKEGCCPSCNGSGRTPGTTGRQTCDPCKGTGVATGAADGAPDSPSSIAEYPREVVCEACGDVVAFGLPNVQRGSTILAAEIVRPDGSHPQEHDFVCEGCSGGGPFTVRDRPRKCLHCGGSGVEVGFPDDDAPNPPPCPCCKGTGRA